jgi:hypothetical protein
MKGVTLPLTKGFEGVSKRGELPSCEKGLRCDMNGPPPKADETFSHSRYLPQMGKDLHLSVLCVSVVRAKEVLLRG